MGNASAMRSEILAWLGFPGSSGRILVTAEVRQTLIRLSRRYWLLAPSTLSSASSHFSPLTFHRLQFAALPSLLI